MALRLNKIIRGGGEPLLAIVLSVMAFYSGVAAPLAPLPLLLFGMQISRLPFYAACASAFLVAAAVPMIVAVASQPLQLVAWWAFTVLGYELYRRECTFLTTVAGLAFGMTALTVVEVVGVSLVQGLPLDAVIAMALRLDEMKKEVAPLGFVGDVDFRVLASAISYSFFGLIFGFWLLLACISALVLRSILRLRPANRGLTTPFAARDLTCWRAPEGLIYLLVLSLLLMTLRFVPRAEEVFWGVRYLAKFGTNVAVGLCFVYFLQGIAIVTYYLNKIKMSVWAVLFLIVIVLQFGFLVLIAGILDNWWDLRRLQAGNRGVS